jgi:hypothetical protein
MTFLKNILKPATLTKAAPFAIGAVALWLLSSKKSAAKIVNTPPEDGSTGQTAITNSVAQLKAKQLFDAMDQLGTNEAAMFNAVKDLNGASLQKVYSAFGIKKYLGFAWTNYIGTDKDLFGWFNEELGGTDLKRMKEIWKKSGLKWT